MQQDRFTQKATQALQNSVQLCEGHRHQQVQTAHLLSSLLSLEESLVPPLLRKHNIDPLTLQAQVGQMISGLPRVHNWDGKVYLSSGLNQVLQAAQKEAERLHDEYVSVEHLFLSLLAQKDEVGKLLTSRGLTTESVYKALQELRGDARITDQDPESKYQALEKYGRNLTALAKAGKLDPVIGRDEEIRRCVQILSRRRKNNPVLIGDPGVGKTAIAEGLAQRIVDNDVPESLKGRVLFTLDIGMMLAGAKYRGEFEERLQAVLQQITKSQGKILCFIDELHTLVGAGAAEGAVDAANMLKPALARGDLRCIGATTLDEYREHIEKDPALERRFQPVLVNEPSVDSTIAILRGLKDKYEVHHGVRIQDTALIAAARLSDRYIRDRFLPDKAIDLIDEAASTLRMEIDSLPREIDTLERRIRQLKVEQQAISRDKDAQAVARREEIEQTLADLEEQSRSLRSSWQLEKDSILKIRNLKQKLEGLGVEEQEAERRGDLARLAEIRYGLTHQVRREMEAEQARLAELQQEHKFLREEVSDEDVAEVVSRWTGVPVNRLLSSERQRLLKMEEHLKARVIKQDRAVEAVCEAVRRNRAGISDPNKPVGTFLFLGPTGVGKTELAKTLATFLFDDEKAMVRLDMSEYMEKHSVSRMIGAPPGYVGHEAGGQLTEAVRRRPYSVVLLDEIEKAHPEVSNVLLQLLDDGRLTDGQGRTVDFRQAIIIMTSNLGSDLMAEGRFEMGEDGKLPRELEAVLRTQFRPEFLNRLDEVVLFQPLSQEALEKIVDLQLERLQKRLVQQRITLRYDAEVRAFLAKAGYDPVYGARPLKRTLQKVVENSISQRLLEGAINPGDTVVLSLRGGELQWNVESPPSAEGPSSQVA